MSNNVHALFERQLDEEYQACTLVAEQMIQCAYQTDTENFDPDCSNISANEQIVDLMSNLNFFQSHGLLPDAAKRIQQLKDFIESTKQMIERTQNYNKLS